MAGTSRRRLVQGMLSATWAGAMLVLGLRLLAQAPHPGWRSSAAFVGLALSAASLALFSQLVTNRLFPARSRRVSDSVELASGLIFIASLVMAAALHAAS